MNLDATIQNIRGMNLSVTFVLRFRVMPIFGVAQKVLVLRKAIDFDG